MNKQETIDALIAAGSIRNRAARKGRMQEIIDAFERFLKDTNLHIAASCEFNHGNATPSPKKLTDSMSRRGRKKAITPDMMPEIGYLVAAGLSYRDIARSLAEEHGLHADRTTIYRAFRRKGAYASG